MSRFVPAVVLGSALLGIYLLYVHFVDAERDPEAVDAGDDLAVQRVVEGMIERIAADALGNASEPTVEQAPLPLESLDDVAIQPPAPPDGYSIVAHHGEMAKDRIRNRSTDATPSRAVQLEWLSAPGSIDAVVDQAVSAGRSWSFGWIRLSDDARPEDLGRALIGTGAELLGSTGPLFRARLPGDVARLNAIAALPQVDGFGTEPPETKLRGFEDDPYVQSSYDQLPVFITLMSDDPERRWRGSLQQLGAVVGRFDPSIRVYEATATYDTLQMLAGADFVQAVEPIRIVAPAHDIAVPAMGADALRTYTGSPGLFSGAGGSSVPVGVMDTGLNINHPDIAEHRQSICGANFVNTLEREAEDLWLDAQAHGTHVTGTIAGNGFVERQLAGMAPSVQHIRIAKVFGAYAYGSSGAISRAMDYFAQPSGCGESPIEAKPLVVNMSLAAVNRTWEGRDADTRKLDSVVWSHRQLYVVSAGNSNIHGFANFGSGKNGLAIGAAWKSGSIAGFSSHGPTVDGRLLPNLVATGVALQSPAGDGSRAGYNTLSGTSMSAPTVSGIAALLMDAAPDHREHPALARARLMASAIRPDAWLEDPAGFPADNSNGPGTTQAVYGMGTASARISVLTRDDPTGWQSGGSTTELEDGEYAYQDIVVPEGTGRLDLVMTWDEPPAETIADTVLNDLDLWLDRGGDCSEEACGEYVSASRVDNVEWIIVRNPEPGTYRAKILANRVFTAAPRAALAWTLIRSPSTPSLTIEADRKALPGGKSEITVTLTSNGYVSTGTRVQIDCRGAQDCRDVAIDSIGMAREDGLIVDATDHARVELPNAFTTRRLGGSITVGEVAVGESQAITVLVSHPDASNASRLYFKANAWNANSASTSIDLGSGDGNETDAVVPGNDGFASATTIEGAEGSIDLDLLLASPEPGEPVFSTNLGRPAGSVWYDWTAPSSGAFQFDVAQPDPSPSVLRNDRIHVFRGDHLSTMEEVASGVWGTVFFAEQGHNYRVRVSSAARGIESELTWSPSQRPANDDIADAAAIEGDSGTVNGDSRGATLEAGEWFGPTAATTWFRWTAPDDGTWLFSVPGKRVIAFEGNSIGSLRLVSGYPYGAAKFPAGQEREYRIVVSEDDAYSSGGPFSLTWAPTTATLANDSVEDAELLQGESSEQRVTIDPDASVQPGEPTESGVRTKWWTWEAPEDGHYTWRVEDRRFYAFSALSLRVAFFRGSADELELMALTGPNASPSEAVVEVMDDERVFISVGFGMGESNAFEQFFGTAVLHWGRTPANDTPANAVALSGLTGSISGSNRFATTQEPHRMLEIGRSAVWWTFIAPESGWYRFSVAGNGGPFVLTVHGNGSDDLDGAPIIASSRWQDIGSNDSEVLFYARADTRHAIAVGVYDGGSGGDFTVDWEPTETPLWLELVGQIASGDRDLNGNPFELRGLGDMTFQEDGNTLYVASAVGLQVLERERSTGALSLLQLLDGDLSRSATFWDAQRSRLITSDCGDWRSFPTLEAGPRLDDSRSLTVVDDPGSCGKNLFMDSSGSFVYRIGDGHAETFAVEASGGLRFSQAVDIDGLHSAAQSADGNRYYAISRAQMHVLERDPSTGMLSQAASEPLLRLPAEGIAISQDGQHLFVFEYGTTTTIFSLENPSSPERIRQLPQFWQSSSFFLGFFLGDGCRFGSVRRDAIAVDAFCRGSAITAHWDPEEDEFEGTDHLGGGGTDRFNNPVPDFGWPADVATSPDGRHIYVTTEDHGLLHFARVGKNLAPDLVIEASANKSHLSPGESFELTAVVRNTGTESSESANVRYFRSADRTISATDIEIGSTEIEALDVDDTATASISVTAPSDVGFYLYGACIDEVAGELDPINNCSDFVLVAVQDDEGI